MLTDLDRDIEEHIALETQDNIERGMSPREARYAALRKFGNVVRAKEETRAVWSIIWLEELIQDIRFGFRTFRKSRGFVAVAILTLGLGIGANTAIFSLIDAVMLKALPAAKASELVVLQWKARRSPNIHGYMSSGDCAQGMFSDAHGATGCSFSEPMFREIEHSSVFSSAVAFANAGALALTGHGPATNLSGQLVSGGFFGTMGLQPAAGRLLNPSDDTPEAAPVAVLNYAYWQREFGRSPDVVGRTLNLNNVPFTVVGVAEPRFNGITPGTDYDVWLPLAADSRISPTSPFSSTARRADPGQWWLLLIARLNPQVPPAQAEAALSGLFRNHTLHGPEPQFHSGEASPVPQPANQLRAFGGPRPLSPHAHISGPASRLTLAPQPGQPTQTAGVSNSVPPADNPEITLIPAPKGLVGRTRSFFANPLYALMAAVGIILLIACANVAGLMLARAAARQKEVAVRIALGAGRMRIIRQLLTESVLLSAMGGMLGVLLAYGGVHAILAFVSQGSPVPIGFAVEVNPRILFFTLVISLGSGVLFGMAPALRGARADLAPALKTGEGTSGSPKSRRARWLSTSNALVVSQMALAMVLLVGAGLMVRTLQNLRNIDVGFDSHNVLLFSLNPKLAGYKPAQVDSLYRDLRERLESTPGVKSASYSMIPLLSNGLMMTAFHWPRKPADEMSESDVLRVGPGFFETMHIPFVTGRNFSNSDFTLAVASTGTARSTVATPVIVNRSFVEKFAGKTVPLGQRFGEAPGGGFFPPSPGYEIIGVVSDTKNNDLRREIHPMMFIPQVSEEATFEIRTAADPQAIVSIVRKVVADIDSSLPISYLQTESDQIDRILFQERLVARVAGAFSLLALGLACIGLYGLLSYEVSRRKREIGIRMALGAQGRDVLHLLIRQGIGLALAGAALGIGVALAVTRYLSSMLYDIRPHDPLTTIAVAFLLILVSLAACFIPARRATRVDPMVTLRYE
jgi:predicted permease